LTGTTGTSTSPAPSRPRPEVRDAVRRAVPGNELDPVVIGLRPPVVGCDGCDRGLGDGMDCDGVGLGGSMLDVMGDSPSTLVGCGSLAASAFGGRTPGWRGATFGTGTPCAHCIPGELGVLGCWNAAGRLGCGCSAAGGPNWDWLGWEPCHRPPPGWPWVPVQPA
jgi:hypothetical protein